MINPNQSTSEDVLRRLKQASYERMRVELKCSIELLLKDFDITWDDLGRLLKLKTMTPGKGLSPGDLVRWLIISGPITLTDLNNLAHVFSAEPYIIFRPRLPWIKT